MAACKLSFSVDISTVQLGRPTVQRKHKVHRVDFKIKMIMILYDFWLQLAFQQIVLSLKIQNSGGQGLFWNHMSEYLWDMLSNVEHREAMLRKI